MSFFSFCAGSWNTDCGCDKTDHFPKDLLYGVCDYYPPTYFYCFFNDGSITSLHGIKRYTKCSAFPERYTAFYQEGFTPEALIDTLVDVCHVKLKHLAVGFDAGGVYIGLKNYNCAKVKDKSRQQKLSQLFSLLQSIDFITSSKQNTRRAKNFFDNIIPCDSIERASFFMYHDNLEFLLSYFLKPSQCHLKYLELDIKEAPSPTLLNVIKHQQELKCLNLHFPYGLPESINEYDPILQCITEDLFYRPAFKTFSYSCSITGKFGVILAFLRAFFSSPYAEFFSFENVISFSSAPLPHPLTIQCHQKKSLKISNCLFSDGFLSLFPPHLVLKSLEIEAKFDPASDNRLISIFSNLEYIEVEEFSITSYINIKNIAIISSLFGIIAAKHWNLELQICDKHNTVSFFVDVLSIIKPGHLHSLNLPKLGLKLTDKNGLVILEVVFYSLIPTADPYFELDISVLCMTEEFARSIHDKWKECMSVLHSGIKPLKKMILSHKVTNIEILMKEIASVVDYH